MPHQRARAASTLPESMRAAAIDRFGPPSVLTLHSLPVPRPGPREILIAVHAAGVGRWDEAVRDGSWKIGRTRFPRVLGTDGAGVVVQAGSRVRRFRVGDRAYAYAADNPKGGFYAEFAAVDERRAGTVPRGLDLTRAGAAAVTALTALQGIGGALTVRRGETVLVFGASGAVGTMAVQFAALRGARVIATASSRRAAAVVRRLGADAVVDARDRRVAERLRALAPDGVDAVLALAGGEELERCLDFVRDRGRIAYPNGIEPEPKRRRRFRVYAYDAEANPRAFAALGRAMAKGRFQVPIAATYPLARAAVAHRRLHEPVLGRIVLRVRRAPARARSA
jgi:NADPH:quinone reductase